MFSSLTYLPIQKNNCCLAKIRFLALNLLELVSYSKFGFSRPEKKEQAEGLERKTRDKKVFI